MLPLEEARQRILDLIVPLPTEITPLDQAAGRVLAQTLNAPLSLPRFDNSAMDGYAVHASDTLSATEATPVTLNLVDRVPAGGNPAVPLQSGQCIRLFTGSPLPEGADAVAMQEDTRVDPSKPNKVVIQSPVAPWENIRLKGEDIQQGALLLAEGQRLTATSVALLGAMGLHEIPVRRQPVVGILSTGGELVEPGQPLARPGQIYESNRAALAVWTTRAGGRPHCYPLVPDTEEAIGRSLRTALNECDVVVTTGGVSVGELDLLKQTFESLGGRRDFWKLAIKPGKPFAFGQLGQAYWFGLPGNPVSALVTFTLLVRPALLALQGCTGQELEGRMVAGRLSERVSNRSNRRHFVRVVRRRSGDVRPTGPQASHMLASLAAANGLLDVPPGATWEAGSEVQVLWLDE